MHTKKRYAPVYTNFWVNYILSFLLCRCIFNKELDLVSSRVLGRDPFQFKTIPICYVIGSVSLQLSQINSVHSTLHSMQYIPTPIYYLVCSTFPHHTCYTWYAVHSHTLYTSWYVIHSHHPVCSSL